MNIDERIEALTQSVELLSQMHQDNAKTYARLFEKLANIAQLHGKRITRVDEGTAGNNR